jgi:hypothetical protein
MVECPGCGSQYQDVGRHWAGSCGYPEIPDENKEILKGLLMGDAYINKPENGNCRLVLKVCNQKFAEYIDQKLGVMSCGVSMVENAESIANRLDTESENIVDDAYTMTTRRHPYFNQLREWYQTGKKTFPEDLELSSEMARMWYVCDGSLHQEGRAQIFSHNEKDRPEYIVSLFEQNGFSPNMSAANLYFSVSETPKFLEWISPPVEGYEYKWNL